MTETETILQFPKTSNRNPLAEHEGSVEQAVYTEDMLVDHETYGRGRITEVSGHGAMRKIRVRFASGERAFIAAKAKLTIVQSE